MNLLRTTQTAAVHTPVMKRQVEEQTRSQQLASSDRRNPVIQLQTKVSKSVLDESSLILSSPFLGNVAAQYRPPPPPNFVPVIVQKVKRKKNKEKTEEIDRPNVDDGEGSGDEKQLAAVEASGATGEEKKMKKGEEDEVILLQPSIDLPAVTTCSLPPLEVAAPARNLCLELLSTRIVAIVRAFSLLLQEFSSSPGQSLPHVGLIGSGNVGHTILSHLVRLLPPDRIVVLARDEKSDICSHFATKFGVRSLSTNILRDDRLVDVVRNHRQQNSSNSMIHSVSTAGKAATAAVRAGARGGAGDEAASHVSPEVAAAHNVSVALQQVHVLIVACRPSQLSEVASSLQPWLRSSAVTVVSALAGITADRVASLFRVPSSLSATVDTNEMLFAFESASLLNARNIGGTSGAAAAAAQQHFLDASSFGGGMTAALSRLPSMAGGGSPTKTAAADRQQQFVVSKSAAANHNNNNNNNNNNNGSSNNDSNNNNNGLPFRFFTREPMDFLHRLFFSLVTALLERCGVQPAAAWIGVAKLLLARALITPPSGIGAQGPHLVAKCSVQHLAAAAGLSVGEVLLIVDARMARFAGVGA